MGFRHGADRHEALLFPERLDDDLAAEHPVRLLEALVDPRDRTTLGCQRPTPAATGRPAYDPAELLKRYIYGDLYRLRSSRRLEQATHRKVALMGRFKQWRPAHETLADFRQHDLAPRRQVCRECTVVCKPRALFAGALVAIDGRQVNAVNAKDRHCTQDTLTTRLLQIDHRLEGDRPALDGQETHDASGTPGGAVAEKVQAQSAALPQRTRRSAAVPAQFEASGATPRSRTDPESRAMQRGKGRGTEGCDNVQTAVDSQHTLVLANDVTDEPGERAGLRPMALQAKAVLGGPFAAVAEVGSSHGAEVKTCLEAGMTPCIARPVTAANQTLGRLSKDDFTSEGATETDPWPAGAPRPCRVAAVALGRHLRSSAPAACTACPLKAPWTRDTGGRRLTRGVEEPLLEAMEPRGRRRPEVMRQRQQRGEHPFGTMNRGWDAGDCLMRGREKGRTEVRLTVLASNLRRVLNLVARPRRLAALG